MPNDQRWEYYIFDVDSWGLDVPTADELGGNGWELVAITPSAGGQYRCYFKRPATPPVKEAP